MRATGAVARIVMAEWDSQLAKLLAENGLSYEDAARYVDDIRAIMKAVKLGWRWNGKELEFREDWKNEEEEEGLTKPRKTARVMNAMMNSIMKGMRFTMEIGEDFNDNSLPTLDTRLWMKDGQIRYSYYEKPMCNKQVVHNDSAMGENSKVASLGQELIRRLKNTNIELEQGKIDGIVDNFTVKLISSGYSTRQAHGIVTSGLKGFEKILKKQIDGVSNIHRPAASGISTRNRRKLTGKTSWFRTGVKNETEKEPKISKGCAKEVPNIKEPRKTVKKEPRCRTKEDKNPHNEDTRTTTVLFVQQTPGGELAKRFREAEKELSRMTGFRVKISERNGTKAKAILQKGNPWSELKCENEECYPCANGDKFDCSRRSIVYKSTCKQCKDEGKPMWYVGESSRSSRERGGEHLNDFTKEKEDSHMLKHLEVAHPGQKIPNFEFRVKASFKSALVRQVTEAVLIRRAGDATLNSKGVFNRCSLPRLTVECGKRESKVNPSPVDATQEWQRWKNSKRNNNDKNRRPSKKIKLDPKEDNPRYEGLTKRKPSSSLGSLQQFQRECKRMRPDFEPELECDKYLEGLELILAKAESNRPTTKPTKICTEFQTPKVALFPIFKANVSNNKENKFPKTQNKSKKVLSSKLGVKKGGQDIRKFLTKRKNPNSLEVGCSQNSEDNRKLGGGHRKQEIRLHNKVSEVNEGLSQIGANLDSIRAGESGGVNLGTIT